MSVNAMPNDPTPIAGGGEPPYHEGMDRRLTILETRFDTLLPTLATKADLEMLRAEFRVELEKLRTEFQVEMEKLRAEFQSALREQTKWMINLVLTLFLGILGVNIAMWSSLKNSVDSLQASVAAGQRSTAQPPPTPRPLVPVP